METYLLIKMLDDIDYILKSTRPWEDVSSMLDRKSDIINELYERNVISIDGIKEYYMSVDVCFTPKLNLK
jgi:hypothetical protein